MAKLSRMKKGKQVKRVFIGMAYFLRISPIVYQYSAYTSNPFTRDVNE
jgi:hypothetical protein